MNISLHIPGEVVEAGQLEDENGEHGIVFKVAADQRMITIKGLQRGEIALLAQALMRAGTLTLSVNAESAPAPDA